MQDFPARLAGSEEERREREPRRQGGEQHRREPVEAAAHDEVRPKCRALVEREVDVAADFQDAVAGADAGEGDKAHHAGDREGQSGDPQRRDAADQRQRNVDHDDQGQHRGAITALQHQEDQQQRCERENADASRRLLVGLIGALQRCAVALRPLRLGEDAADIGDDLRAVARAVAVGVDGDAALTVLPEDLIGAVGLLDFTHWCPVNL